MLEEVSESESIEEILKKLKEDLDRVLKKSQEREKELKKSKEQLDTIFSNLKDTVFVISEGYKILFKNNTAHDIFGKELIGKDCFKVIKGQDQVCERCPMKTFAESDLCQVRFEQCVNTPLLEGERVFDIVSSPIKSYAGQLAMVEVLRDITEMRKLREELKEHRDHLEYLVGERIKELNCLYRVTKIIEEEGLEIEEVLAKTVDLLPLAWRFSEITCARIVVDGQEYKTENYKETNWKQSSNIIVNNEKVGIIEVIYLEEKPAFDEGPFMNEERDLIDSLTAALGRYLEHKKVGEINLILAAIVENSDDAIIGKTLDGTIISWNKGAERIYSYTSEEIIGKPISILVPSDRPDEVPGILERIKAGIHIDHFETVRVRKDGEEIKISLTISPIMDKDGSIIGASTIARDISETKKAEQKLRKAQEQLNTIFSNLEDTVFVISEDYKILFKNDSAHDLFGEELIGKICHEVIKGLDQPCERCPIKIFLEKDVCQFRFEQCISSPIIEGTKYFDIISTPIENYDGQPAIVELLRDITESRKIREELKMHHDNLKELVEEQTFKLTIRNKISNIFLTIPDEEMYNEVLNIVLDVMESKFGTFGYIDEDDALVIPSMTRHIWDQCQVGQKTFIFPRDTWGDSIWPRAIRQKKTLYSNERSTLTPEGHVSIERNISTPIIYRGKVIGLLQAANKEIDYTKEDLQLIETIANQIAPILSARLQKEMEEKKRKIAEDDLKESEEWLSTTLRSIGDAVITTGIKGNITFLNPVAESLTGWKQEEAIEKPIEKIFNIINEETRNQVENPISRVIREGIVVGLANHTILISKDGKEIPITDSGAPIKDKEGNNLGVVLIFRDITERRRAEEKLKHRERDLFIQNELSEIFLTTTDKEMYHKVLEFLKDIMQSEYGYFGYINEYGDLVCPSLTYDVWYQCQVKDKDIIFPYKNWRGLWGKSLLEKKILYLNKDLDVPEGHIQLNNSIAAPIMLKDKVIGQLALGNKSTGYNEKDKKRIEYIADFIAPVLNARIEHMKAEERDARKAVIMNARNAIFQKALTCESEEDLGKTCLEVAQELSGAKFGFFGEINQEGKFDTIAISNPGWDTCKMPDSEATRIIKGMEIRGMQFLPLVHGKSYIFNDPGNHPDSVGTPKGHPKINCLLTVPFIYKGEIIGQIGLGNKEGGFNRYDQEAIEALSIAMIEAFMRKRAEEAVKESELRFRSVFESKMIGTLFWDANGDINNANDAFLDMVGYTRDEVLSRSVRWRDMTPPEYTEQDNKALEEIATTGAMTPIEKEYIRKDGSRIPILLGAASLPGPTLNGVAFVVDNTERKRAEEKLNKTLKDLKRSNTELEQFAYVASHDLQEPLRMVASFTQLLQNRYQDKLDDDANDFINYAVDGATRMQNLISDLLIFSRVGTRGKPFKTTDVNAVLEAVIATFQQKIKETNTTLTYNPLPVIIADESQMIQLLQNLISNAIKFRSEEPPRIHVSGEVQADKWIFSVSDNGIGIDSTYFDRIFVIFQRLHKKDEYGGTGIGLAVCKKIIQRHGGKIWVESELGKGSTFYFSIPKKKVGKKK